MMKLEIEDFHKIIQYETKVVLNLSHSIVVIHRGTNAQFSPCLMYMISN